MQHECPSKRLMTAHDTQTIHAKFEEVRVESEEEEFEGEESKLQHEAFEADSEEELEVSGTQLVLRRALHSKPTPH